MAEAQNFYYGGATFPLTSSTTRSLLRDADPAVYYALEFYAQVITTHLGTRLLAEATAAGATKITAAVAETLPIDPEQYLTEEHVRFPLLTLHREGTTYRYVNRRRAALHKLKLAYVLPPLKPAQAERLIPILHAVGLLIDQKSAQGKDPAYTPTTPAGTAGEFVWSYARAGVKKVDVKESAVGAFVAASNELYFPSIVMTIEMDEMGDSDATDGSWTTFQGADVEIDERSPDGTTLEAVDDFNTYGPPDVVSLSPTSGSAIGGTLVTITGIGFRTGTRPVVLFDGAAADAVSVTNSTTITCRTPPHAAYPSFVADVMVIAADGQSDTLDDAFTFTA
jgi:hypothetical protein